MTYSEESFKHNKHDKNTVNEASSIVERRSMPKAAVECSSLSKNHSKEKIKPLQKSLSKSSLKLDEGDVAEDGDNSVSIGAEGSLTLQ